MSYTLSDETGKLIDNNYIWNYMSQPQYSDYYVPPARPSKLPSDLISSIVNFSRPVKAVSAPLQAITNIVAPVIAPVAPFIAPVVAPVVAPLAPIVPAIENLTPLQRLKNRIPTYDPSRSTPETFRMNRNQLVKQNLLMAGKKK